MLWDKPEVHTLYRFVSVLGKEKAKEVNLDSKSRNGVPHAVQCLLRHPSGNSMVSGALQPYKAIHQGESHSKVKLTAC